MAKKKKKYKEPRPMSLVKFREDPKIKDIRHHYPFKENEHLLFLEEVVNMPGHCVVISRKGDIMWGYHTDNFIELTDEEI